MEYERQQEFASQLLSCCHIENRYYLIPSNIADEMLKDHEDFICNDFSRISLVKKIKCTETIESIINEIKEQNRDDNLYLKNSEIKLLKVN